MATEEKTATRQLSRVGDVEHRGVFVYVGSGYGFIMERCPCGTMQQHFLRSATLKETRKGELKIKDLDGRTVRFKVRASTDPRHSGKLEACQVSLLDGFLLPG
jgi:hypothetical protein